MERRLMEFNRPTLETLIKRNQADIETSIPGADAKVRRTNLNIISKIISLTAHGLYGFIAFIARQLFPATAETEYLDRIASFWLKVPRKAASYATGFVDFVGVNGTLIEGGTVLIRSDGMEYETDADYTIASGTVIAAVTALQAGQNSNAEAGTVLSMSSPIAGITGSLVVNASGISGGSDQEEDKNLSDRVTARVQNPPHGGSKKDYEAWALEVPGVTRAWVYDNELGAGTLTVRFVRDDDANLIPDAGEVATVQAYIDNVRQVGLAAFSVVAPIAAPINFTIQLTPNNSTVRAAVTAELTDLLKREGAPATTILLSHTREAISLAAGETNYVMTVPNADITHATGYMPTMGVITWL
jgi:uncharacterized phage protein gp47/JayE